MTLPIINVADALEMVGLSLAELADVIPSSGDAYLIGSLAAGLGNGASDVDVAIFGASEAPRKEVRFVPGRDRMVDLEWYPMGEPMATLRGLGPSGDTPFGRVGLDPPPPLTAAKAHSRWMSAVPLNDPEVLLIEASYRADLQSMLVRHALNDYLLYEAAARLVSLCRPSEAGAAWARAGIAWLEVLCRAAGDVFIGGKWLPRKAARSGITTRIQQQAAVARSKANVCALTSATGGGELLDDDFVVVRVPRNEALQLGDQSAHLVDGGIVVLGELESVDGLAIDEAIGQFDACTVVEAITRHAILMAVDDKRLTEALTG